MSDLNIALEGLLGRAAIYADVIIFREVKNFLRVRGQATSDEKTASSEDVTLLSTIVTLTSFRPKNRTNVTTLGGTLNEDDDTYKECVCEIIFELVKLMDSLVEISQLVELLLGLANASNPDSKYNIDLGEGNGFWDGIAGVLTGVMAERWTIVDFPTKFTPDILKGNINLNAFVVHFWSGLENESKSEDASNVLFAKSAKLHWIVCQENALGSFPSAVNNTSIPKTPPTGGALQHYLTITYGWIIHAAELLYKYCQDNTSAADPFGRISLWDRGLSPEGWTFWTEQFREVSQNKGESEASRIFAEQCWKAMEKASLQN